MEHPLVAIIASSAAESRIRDRGFNSISRLLQPFASHSIAIRDPSTSQHVNARITLDFRDLNKEGHLLTLSVLPHVLYELLQRKPQLADALESFSSGLKRWAEPIEQETFRTYLACVFVVAGCEENPLSELSKLVQIQHTQQHSTADSKVLTPSHCAPPKWTSPNTLKHYFLLHDVGVDDESRSTAVFNEMCSTYGIDSCQMLRVGESATFDDLPDPWDDLEEEDAILAAGLHRALQHAAASAMAQQNLERKSNAAASVSTISPSYAMVQSANVPTTELNGFPAKSSPIKRTHNISNVDREALTNVTQKFLKDCLVPHAERLMRTLFEQLAARRGLIGKSLTSGMKKWFGGGSASSLTNLATVSFPSESLEMQSRRLADLAFMFGLFSFAYAQYRSVKKDFEHSQAWLHHAAATEMAAVALYLSDSSMSPKHFPRHYFEAALENQLNYSGKYTTVMRCAFNAATVLGNLSLKREAASLLSTVTTLDNDMCVAVTHSLASRYFEEAKLMRKAAFYRVLGGNRFMKAGLKQNALECYRLALHKYVNTNWDSIEDHLAAILSADTTDRNVAIDCASRLLRENDTQTDTSHAAFVDNFVETLTRFKIGEELDPVHLPVPLMDVNSVRVICGERPQPDDAFVNNTVIWIDLERAAFHTLAGSSTAFRPIHLVSDNETDNQRARSTPPDERFRVEFGLRNPLKSSLTLKNVRLGMTDIHMREGFEKERSFSEQEVISSLEFRPEEFKKVTLWVRPTSHLASFRVERLLFEVVGSAGKSICGYLPISVRGKRLNKNAKQMKSVVYALDERLHATVAQKSWPLLDFRVSRKNQPQIYCGQAVTMDIEVENIGRELVTGLCLATDGVDCTNASLSDKSGKRKIITSCYAPTCSAVRTFDFGNVRIAVGERMRLYITVRAPAFSYVETNVGLLFFYRGESHTYREWRTVLTLEPTPLFEASASVLDETHGIVAINMKNVILANDAALARCEVMRIRLVEQRMDNKGHWNETDASYMLQPMRIGAVQLDCEQSCSVGVYIVMPKSGSSKVEGMGKSSWCLSALPPDLPAWPPGLPDCVKSADETSMLPENYVQVAVLWKASVVNNEGHVSSIVGETFIDDSSLNSFLKSSEKGCMAASMSDPVKSDRVGDQLVEGSPLVITCRSIKPIIHSFTNNRLSQFPLEVAVTNVDERKRFASITLKYSPKVHEAVSSLTQLPPENRQQWWIDREVVKAVVENGRTELFRFIISVSQPSVYDVAGSQLVLEAVFSDGETRTFKVPNTLAVVIQALSHSFFLNLRIVPKMASQTQGIQQLLAAEKRAAEKINEARKRKFQRMKQAKQEAQAEVEKYRQEREQKFKQYEQTYLGTKEDIESKIRRDTENEIEAMKKNVLAHKQQVIVRLLQLVCDIKPELHHNLILQKKLHGQFS
ncbi:unnamed protein product [Cylicocyclus nassatus]|uniref:TPPC8 first Ig-like domain-containing protein n=1 Tax=Cylicocyclus nassatus TaxID=53992 RepID=A0AA36GLI1_CYLNA|nr:unnamed protein product [Cylicocyclus nassatus]